MSSTLLVVWSELYTTYNQTVSQSFHFTDLVSGFPEFNRQLIIQSITLPVYLSPPIVSRHRMKQLMLSYFQVSLQNRTAAHSGLKGKNLPKQNKTPHQQHTYTTFNSAININKQLQILQHVKDRFPKYDPLEWYVSSGIFPILSKWTSRNLSSGNEIKIT